jgi:hypothetical protein
VTRVDEKGGGEWALMLPFALQNAGSGAELYLNLLLRDIRWLSHTKSTHTRLTERVHRSPTKFERMILEPCSNSVDGSPAFGLLVAAGALGIAAAAGCLGATTARRPLMLTPRPRLRMPLPRGLADMISIRRSALDEAGGALGARIPSRDLSREDIMAGRGDGRDELLQRRMGGETRRAGCEEDLFGAVDEREEKNRRWRGEMLTGLGEEPLPPQLKSRPLIRITHLEMHTCTPHKL